MKKRIISTILVIVIIINQITTSYANPAVFGALKEFGAWAAPQIASMSLSVLYDKLIKGFGENPQEKALIQVDGEQLQEEILKQLVINNQNVKDTNLVLAILAVKNNLDVSNLDFYQSYQSSDVLSSRYDNKYVSHFVRITGFKTDAFYSVWDFPSAYSFSEYPFAFVSPGSILAVTKNFETKYVYTPSHERKYPVQVKISRMVVSGINSAYVKDGSVFGATVIFRQFAVDPSFYVPYSFPFDTIEECVQYIDNYLSVQFDSSQLLEELKNQNLVIKASLDDLKKGLVEFATQEDLANKELKKINLSNNKLMENINNDTSKIQKTLEKYFKNEKKIAKDSQNATIKQLEKLKKAITDKQDKEIKLDKQIKEQTEKIANLLEKQNKEKEKYNKQALENDRELKRQFDELLERQKEELENEQAIRKQLERDRQDLSSQSFDKIKEMLGEQIDNQNDLIGKLNKFLSIEEKENIIISDILKEEKKGNEKNNVSLNSIENKLDDIIGLLKLIVKNPKDLVVPKNEWYDEKYNKLKDKLNKQLRIDYLITEIKKIEDLDDGDLNVAFKDLEATIMGKKVKIVDFSYIRKNREKIQYITGGFFYLLLLLYNYREIRKMLSK